MEAVKKAVGEVVTSATPANEAIKAAADAAAPLVAKVPSGEAQKGAALASIKAGDAARAAEKALEALTKTKGDYDKAVADGDGGRQADCKCRRRGGEGRADKAKTTAATAAKTAAREIVKQATALGGAAKDAGDGATETGRQAVAPDLPVLTDDDQVTFAALRARITGGAIFFNGMPSVTVTGEGDAATAAVSSDQFSQSAMYLAFESQPSLISFKHSVDRGYSRWIRRAVLRRPPDDHSGDWHASDDADRGPDGRDPAVAEGDSGAGWRHPELELRRLRRGGRALSLGHCADGLSRLSERLRQQPCGSRVELRRRPLRQPDRWHEAHIWDKGNRQSGFVPAKDGRRRRIWRCRIWSVPELRNRRSVAAEVFGPSRRGKGRGGSGVP